MLKIFRIRLLIFPSKCINKHLFVFRQISQMKLTQLDSQILLKKPNHSENLFVEEQKNKNNNKLIKRKQHFHVHQIKSINLKHIVNVSDIWFINEQTLKDPESSNQNIHRAMFRYKMISRIVLNSSYIGLELKKVDDNYLPPEYFFQRFRSLGDCQIAEIANSLQSVYILFNQIKQAKEEYFKLKKHNAIDELNKFLKEMEGKMYTIYFVEISKNNVNLKHIFFSVLLLQKLGWNIKRVTSDFLKYRHVFFEIFSPKNYKNYIQICLDAYFKSQQLEKDSTLTEEQKKQMTTVQFDDEVVREIETSHGVYEEFLKAKVRFSCPNAAFCCAEIVSIDENPTERYIKKKKRIYDIIEISPVEEIRLLKKLGFESSFLELQNKEKNEINDNEQEKGN